MLIKKNSNRSVHYLNVWSVSVNWNVMSVHLSIDPHSNADKILLVATELARDDFHIKHSTIQIERHDFAQLPTNGADILLDDTVMNFV